MLRYAVRRILSTIPVVIVVAVVVFALFFVMPGDPAVSMAGENASPEQIAELRQSLGLDQPFHVQFRLWVSALAKGDLGRSVFTGLPVVELIGQRLEPTISLAMLSILLSVTVAVPLGIAAAWKAGSLLDRFVIGGAVFAFSVPGFVIGYFLMLIFAVKLRWLPVQGFVSIREGIWPFLERMILPSVTVSLVLIALFARVTRAAMIDVLKHDYIRTARAKGLPSWEILGLHALKNAAIPIVTVIGLSIAMLIGGLIVTETVFALPGLGTMTVDAITRRDYPVIQGLVLLFSLIYIVVNMLVDLSYPFFDPRIRY